MRQVHRKSLTIAKSKQQFRERLSKLARLAAQGDRQAFEGLLRLHRSEALRYARAVLRDADLAEDALQEAWLDCHQKLPELKDPGAFVFWFRRIVFKQCDRLRRRRDFETRPVDPQELAELQRQAGRGPDTSRQTDPATRLAEGEERRELRRRLREAYRGLSRAERRLARLRFLRQKSYDDIARELAVPTDTVKNRLRILRRRLRFALGPMGADRAGFSVHGRLECRVLCA